MLLCDYQSFIKESYCCCCCCCYYYYYYYYWSRSITRALSVCRKTVFVSHGFFKV